MEDEQLLRQYSDDRSQAAFQALVERNVGMVYSAARRMVGDSHLAEEIAQTAFVALAQKAASVRRPQVVGGWLYNTTRHLAMHAVRSEQRRREREQIAVAMQSLNAEPNADEIAEQLEPAMEELDEADRGALVLRFLENRNFRDVGAELGITEDAARMRVNRAVERLREVFARRGTALTSAALVGAIGAATVKAVPAGLAAAILAAGSKEILTTVTIMNWINTKSVVAIAAAALLAGTAGFLVQKQKTDQLQAQIDSSLAELGKAQADTQAAQQALAARDQELQKLHTDTAELARTRSEIAKLRQEQQAAAQAAAVATKAPARPAGPVAFPPGTYVNRGQLAFAGYATPEATIQTLAWAAVNGQTNIVQRVIPTDLPQGQQLVQQLQMALEAAGPAFQGMQVAGEKLLADDRVELMVKVDTQAVVGGTTNLPPPFNIIPMVRVNNEWKMGGSPSDYTPEWQTTGQIKMFAQ